MVRVRRPGIIAVASHRVEAVTAISYPLAERTLANGLRVIVSEDHTVPNVAVNLWVGVRPRHETPGCTGFAHLFEHLMFQGSRNVASGEHFSALMDVGARLNATTWFDRTNYFETVPTGALELALWLEADRHGHLLDALTQEYLDKQRGRRQGGEAPALRQRALRVGPHRHLRHRLPEDHPTTTRRSVDGGSRRRHPRGRPRLLPGALRAQQHRPHLVGDVTPEEGFAAAEKYFGPLPAIELSCRARHPQLSPLAGPVRLDRVGDVPNDRIYVSFRLPVDTTPDYLAARSPSMSSAASRARGSCVGSSVRRDGRGRGRWTMGLVDGSGLGTITVDVSAGADVDEVESAVCEEIRRFVEEGPDCRGAGVRHRRHGALVAQRPRRIEERADHISHHALLTGDAAYVNTFVDASAP